MNEILEEDMLEEAVEENGSATGSHDMGMMDGDNHMGCQEGEIVDGKCVIAEDGEQNTDLFAQLDEVNVMTEAVEYYDEYEGYLAQPNGTGTYPAVVMIHEWWGLNDNIRDMAKLLANEGYVVLAVDLYGEVAETSDRAGELAGAAREDAARTVANLQAAVEFLRTLPNVENEQIASMGWCFGGQQSLRLALASADDLAATVIYYGQLETDQEKLQNLDWPILGIFGSEDTSITVADVEAFNTAIDNLGIENDIYMYKGVGHAFANPSGSRYAPNETLDAWNKTVTFLNTHLKEE